MAATGRQGRRTVVTIRDVAGHARVAPATVSRVLAGDYPVAARTRARVEKAIKDLGYVRNAHAQALRALSTAVVGVIIHDVGDPHFSEVVAGIQEAAAASGRLVLLCNSLRDPRTEGRCLRMLRGQRVDAVIFTGGAIGDPVYLDDLQRQVEELLGQGGRVVMCGRPTDTASAVLPDNRGGAYRLTCHLLDHGHSAIAEIKGSPLHSTTADRSWGHHQALAERGIAPDPDLSVSGGFNREGGYQAMRKLLDRGGFTAVAAANDLMALGALAALREVGLRVPDDMSLVGFGDIPAIRDIVPGITTMRVPMRELGRQSMSLALASGDERPRVMVLPVELVERESVGPPALR